MVAGAVVGLCAALVAGPAGAAPPEPDATTEIASGFSAGEPIIIGDDAVYYTVTSGETRRSVIYSRTLTRDESGTHVGPASYVGRSHWDVWMAEHDGTLAYTRSVDDRLVLRAPDGTEQLPEWGDSPDLAGGVVALTGSWLVGADYPYEPSYTLFNRQTGQAYDLAALVTVPAEFTWKRTLDITISDARAMFRVVAEGTIDGVDTVFDGLYTVALGTDGLVGPVTTLESGSDPLNAVTFTYYETVGVDGGRIYWTVVACTSGGCDHTLRWRDAPPYDATPSEAPIDDSTWLSLDGGTIIAARSGAPHAETVEWLSPENLTTPLRTLELPDHAAGVRGDLVLRFDTQAYVIRLTDADGDPVDGDQTPPPQLVEFSDVTGASGDPFADEIMWLADHGVIGGYSDGTFRHLNSVSRDAMAAFLYRLANPGAEPADCTGPVFDDVDPWHPFCPEIAWLADTGITTGFPDGTFLSATPVTREAMAAYLYRLAHDGAKAPACTAPPFADVTTGHPFCGEIAWLASTGVSRGWPDGTFRPGAWVERQAMAAFLFRYIDAGLVPAPPG